MMPNDIQIGLKLDSKFLRILLESIGLSESKASSWQTVVVVAQIGSKSGLRYQIFFLQTNTEIKKYNKIHNYKYTNTYKQIQNTQPVDGRQSWWCHK